MRSGELARLAGVTVRALRHYHRVGVLAEPERRSNGYREYDVHDLVRVLRIRRLAALGVPLETVRGLLDDDGGADDVLDELDAELARQVERLTTQRRLVAALRAHGAAPDLPPELAPFFAVYAGADLPPEQLQLDRDQSVLLAHFAGEDGMAHLSDFYARLSDPAVVPDVTEVVARFGRLGPASTDEEVGELVERFLATFTAVIEEFEASGAAVDLGAAAGVMSEYTSEVLNEQQRRFLQEVEARLSGSGEASAR